MFTSKKNRFRLLLLALATIAFVACGRDDTAIVAPQSDSQPELSVDAESPASALTREPRIAEYMPFIEYRFCTGKTSDYTPNKPGGTGKGTGTSIKWAQDMAILDALKKDVYSQFKCATCTEGNRCEQFYSFYDLAGAIMTSPATDCSYDSTTSKYTCEGAVDFQLGTGTGDPYLKAGCLECD